MKPRKIPKARVVSGPSSVSFSVSFVDTVVGQVAVVLENAILPLVPVPRAEPSRPSLLDAAPRLAQCCGWTRGSAVRSAHDETVQFAMWCRRCGAGSRFTFTDMELEISASPYEHLADKMWHTCSGG